VCTNSGEEVQQKEMKIQKLLQQAKKGANESQFFFEILLEFKYTQKNTRRIHLININPILGMCCGFSSSKK
jgi:hypothetical protein